MANDQPEFWQLGPIDGIDPVLQPVAHALLQARKEVLDELDSMDETLLWLRPSNVASIGFHLQHLSGVLDRLFTYARGASLDDQQLAFLRQEGKEADDITSSFLLQRFNSQVELALGQLRDTAPATFLEVRFIGRKQIPTNTIGLLFHAAEHTQRHVGQLLVTHRILSKKD